MALLDELIKRIEPLDEAVEIAAWADQAARLLMTHPGVGLVVSLAYVLFTAMSPKIALTKPTLSYTALYVLSAPQP
jgi:hypothetical protein